MHIKIFKEKITIKCIAYMKVSNIVAFLFSVSNVFGFIPTVKQNMKTFKYEGDIAPMNYFDPLGISSNLNEQTTKYIREAELHHGRVAMCSMVILPLLDFLDKEHLAINKLSSLRFEEQLPYLIGMAAFEAARMKSGWKDPFTERNAWFKLEEEYQPGNIFNLSEKYYQSELLNRELSNGRLAMIASIGYICQELATGAKCL